MMQEFSLKKYKVKNCPDNLIYYTPLDIDQLAQNWSFWAQLGPQRPKFYISRTVKAMKMVDTSF